jgi:hypothetical protein
MRRELGLVNQGVLAWRTARWNELSIVEDQGVAAKNVNPLYFADNDLMVAAGVNRVDATFASSNRSAENRASKPTKAVRYLAEFVGSF